MGQALSQAPTATAGGHDDRVPISVEFTFWEGRETHQFHCSAVKGKERVLSNSWSCRERGLLTGGPAVSRG